MNFVAFFVLICALSRASAILPIIMDPTICCAGTIYNRNAGVCCDDVFIKNEGKKISRFCCGKEAYEYPNQLCNDNQILNNPYGNNGAICGNEVYDRSEKSCCANTIISTKDKICCNGKVHDNSIGVNGRCCGEQVYDYTKSTCCGTKVQPTDKNLPFCCGELPYNMKESFCFYGDKTTKLIPIPSGLINPQLCYDKVYDYNKSVCCNKVEIERPTTGVPVYCCGSEFYNPQKQVCCYSNNEVFDKPDPKANYQCCGKEIFKQGEKLCCKDVPSNDVKGFACCGAQSYNTKTSICCNNQILERIGTKTSCCNGELYDPKLQQCCLQKIYDIPPAGKCNKECFGGPFFFGPGPVIMS